MSLRLWHSPDSREEKEDVNDSQQPKASSPPKKLVRNTRENAT